MGDNRIRFKKAQEQWTLFKSDGDLSLPAAQGRIAIVCSYYTDMRDDSTAANRPAEDAEVFKSEALAIADALQAHSQKSEVILNAMRADMAAVLTDPSTVSVITIGHGCLSALALGDAMYDWVDVCRDMDHLKTGYFMQRQCGLLSRNFNVPLGLFAVLDQTSVFAATGMTFEPTNLEDPVNELLMPVFHERSDVNYDAIKQGLRPKTAD